MKVYALDETNIESFDFLVDPKALLSVKQGAAQGLCVKEEEAHVGALVGLFTDEKEYEILSLYVLPEYRRRGVGTKLLAALKDVLKDEDTDVSISFANISPDEEALTRFLENEGFEEYRSTTGHIFSVTVGDLLKTTILSAKAKANYPSLSDLPGKMISALEELKSEGFIPKPLGGFASERIDREASTAVFKGEEPVAYAVVEKENDKLLSFSSLYVREGENPATLTRLLYCGLTRLKDKYSEDTVILLPTVNEEAEKLIEGLFEGITKVEDVSVTYRRFFPADSEIEYGKGSLTDFIIEQTDLLSEEQGEQ